MSSKTEQALKKLLDYQRFGKDPRLERMITATEACVEELSDEELTLVSAAGEITEDFTKQVRIKTNYKLNDE